MAGIGFELKKVFQKKGIFNGVKAYGCAMIVCAGPMILGVIMLFGIIALCAFFETPTQTRELLVSMITYTLLASVTVSSFFSMVITRYLSDMLFAGELDRVLPSFWGSSLVMMTIGGLLYGSFLLASGATFLEGLLCFILFEELMLGWNAMSCLTAIKDYKSVILSYTACVAVAVLLAAVLLWQGLPVITAVLFAVTVGYGVMVCWNVVLLYRYFPAGKGGIFRFFGWFDRFFSLALFGLLMNIGMFSHIVITWFSEIGHCVRGLSYEAPWYDVPALLAFMTSLITTVNFVVSVEVNFYPKYRDHYSLYNGKGTISDIQRSEREMLDTLKTELLYTSLKQLLFTVACIALGGTILDWLPLGFNEEMRGYFRTLCVAYGLYAIGNMLMLILLYFTDYRGAFWCAALFAGSTVVLTMIGLRFSYIYYGFGFLIGALLLLVTGCLRLDYFTKRLPYYILSVQPLVAEKRSGIFTKIGDFLEKMLEEKQGS